jgi:hypothetical protein
MTERDTDQAAAAAEARVAALFERAARVNLGVVVVAPPDATRVAAREVATAAADGAGRGGLLDEATAAARDVVLKAFAGAGFSGTWAATEMSVSVASASDRVAVVAALEEAAVAAVAEDVVDDETLETLRATWDELGSSSAIPSPGSLASVAAPPAGVIRGPTQVAIVGAVVLIAAIVGFALGGYGGLILVFVGVAVVGAVAGRRSGPAS